MHPVTKKSHTWLMVNIGADSGKTAWGLGCVLCRWADEKSPFGKCIVRQLSKLDRHGDTAQHMNVMRSWSDKVLANSGGKTPVVTHGGQTPKVTHGGKTPKGTRGKALAQSGGVGYGHILKMLEIFEEQAPLRSFTEKLQAADRSGADIIPGNSSRTVAEQLMLCCAGRENDCVRRSQSYVESNINASDQPSAGN